MILIDTSAWVEFFRGRDPIARAVDAAIASAEAALCGPIVTEIRRGLRAPERRRVLPLLDGCALLDQPEDLWLAAGDLGAHLSRKGATVKTLDLLIATYAIAHSAPLLTIDADFRVIAHAGVGLSLAT
jgi:predicted nucleic acid-binding protein